MFLKRGKDKEEGSTTIGEVYIQKAIDHIINATHHDPNEFVVRKKMATSMRRAINMSTQAGGDINEPKKTVLYRFATLLDGCKSFEELEKKCIKAFDERGDCRAEKLLFKFDFDWKMPYVIPPIEKKPAYGKRGKSISEDKASEVSIPEQSQKPDEKLIEQQEEKAEGILALAVQRLEALERTNASLVAKVEKFTAQLRAHSHLDGKVVVITEV